jgi:ABC-type transport system involved in multi-copper enzyme maturation permease subunit
MVNAVLVNDLRKSLFRRKPVAAVALMAVAILILTFAVAGFLPVGSAWQLRQMPIWYFLDMALPLVAPAFAAGAFAKEHEQSTWQDVILTRLTAREILSGKFFACLIPTLAVLIVLFPPFAMMLILQNVDWAMEPGPWMLIVGLKFLVSATFYLALVMVCSYHSTRTRTALVVGYVLLGVYVLLNYMLWNYVLLPCFLPDTTASNALYYNSHDWAYPATAPPGQTGTMTYTNFWSTAAPWQSSAQTFSLSLVEKLHLLQSALLGAGLLAYLARRLRRRI